MNRLAVWLILLLSFCGLADSAYLAEHEADGTPLLCNLDGLSGCNIVAQSSYSHFFGIPLGDYGLAFYGLLFILTAIEIAILHRHIRRIIQAIAAVGLIASAYFFFLQVSVINAICVYCTISAGISLLIFIFAYFLEPLSRSAAIILPAPSFRSPLTLPPSV